jgi:hypothetical protein
MGDSSNSLVASEFEIEEYTKPSEFLFYVENSDGAIVVSICPEEYFVENGYLDDQYYSQISDLLENNNFSQIMDATYEYDTDDGLCTSVEEAQKILRDLGFKESPEFNKYMEETTTDFSFNSFSGDDVSRLETLDTLIPSGDDDNSEEE